MKLDELLNEAMSIAAADFAKDAKKKGNDYVINKNVGGVDYEIRFYPARSRPARRRGAKMEKIWALQFRTQQKKGVLRKSNVPPTDDDYKVKNFNKGQEFKLFPLVLGYLTDFIKTKKPDAFMFSADADEPSRVSVYKAIAKRYKKEIDRLGYRMMSDDETKDMDDSASFIPFVFIRKELQDDDDMFID